MKQPNNTKPRVLPGLIAASVIAVGLPIGILLNLTMPNVAGIGMLVSLIAALAVVVWWLFFSRVPRRERWGAFAVVIAAWFAMRPFLDKSIIGGAMGALPIVTLPVLAVALVVWMRTTQNLSTGIRTVSLVATL